MFAPPAPESMDLQRSSGRKDWGRTALIGGTGFVGGVLSGQQDFDRSYASRTIGQISGESFDTVICCGAPATMWIANANPDLDRRNLEQLADWIDTAAIGRLVLISTIAVLDDVQAGYTESTARYETAKAYGRHRRALEERVLARSGSHVLRLPALFGPGLKKNFVFDVLNPVPSFLKSDVFASALDRMDSTLREKVGALFTLDDGVGAWKLDRPALDVSPERRTIEAALAGIGLSAANFTNADSAFQYYNLAHLADDIDVCLSGRVQVLNVCSEPWRAGDVHEALTGRPFVNDGPPVVREDMRTDHAGAFGKTGPYLYSREQTRAELLAFAGAA